MSETPQEWRIFLTTQIRKQLAICLQMAHLVVVDYSEIATSQYLYTQSEYDAKLFIEEVQDLRAGSTMIEIENGQAALSLEVEESSDLAIWATGAVSTIQIPLDAEAGKKFFRFKMTD